MGRLDGKVAIVTGASAGMGLGASLDFAKEGAKVVMMARNQEKLDAAVAQVKEAGGAVVGIAGDVSKEADCKALVDKALAEYGKLDIAFNNAGQFLGAPFEGFEESMMDNLLGVNVKSVMFCLKYQLPAMAKTADGKGSIIVNSSVMGQYSGTTFAETGHLYAATKAAVDMLVRYAAVEGAKHGTRVNTISPGVVATSLMPMDEDGFDTLAKPLQLLGRAGRPHEIAKQVTFLASDDASFVTGSVNIADGGWSIKAP